MRTHLMFYNFFLNLQRCFLFQNFTTSTTKLSHLPISVATTPAFCGLPHEKGSVDAKPSLPSTLQSPEASETCEWVVHSSATIKSNKLCPKLSQAIPLSTFGSMSALCGFTCHPQSPAVLGASFAPCASKEQNDPATTAFDMAILCTASFMVRCSHAFCFQSGLLWSAQSDVKSSESWEPNDINKPIVDLWFSMALHITAVRCTPEVSREFLWRRKTSRIQKGDDWQLVKDDIHANHILDS